MNEQKKYFLAEESEAFITRLVFGRSCVSVYLSGASSADWAWVNLSETWCFEFWIHKWIDPCKHRNPKISKLVWNNCKGALCASLAVPMLQCVIFCVVGYVSLQVSGSPECGASENIKKSTDTIIYHSITAWRAVIVGFAEGCGFKVAAFSSVVFLTKWNAIASQSSKASSRRELQERKLNSGTEFAERGLLSISPPCLTNSQESDRLGLSGCEKGFLAQNLSKRGAPGKMREESKDDPTEKSARKPLSGRSGYVTPATINY